MLVNSRKQITKTLSRASTQEMILGDLLQLRNGGFLADVSKRNKISWQNSNPYNKRWQYKWKHAYYAYPRENHEHEYVKKPEDSKEAVPLFWNWWQDIAMRTFPGFRCAWERRHRMYDSFSVYFLPFSSLLCHQFADITFGFQVLPPTALDQTVTLT